MGGSSRKNRRSSSSLKKSAQNHSPPKVSPQNPNVQEGQTLNYAFSPSTSFSSFNGLSQFAGLPAYLDTPHNTNRSQSGGLTSSFVTDPMPMADDTNSIIYSSGLVSTREFNPCLNFSSHWVENGYGIFQGVDQDRDNNASSSNFEGFKTNEELDQESSNEYIWNGMLAGRGSPW